MSLRISDYANEHTVFNNEDLYDVSAYLGVGSYESRRLKHSTLIAAANDGNGIYDGNGTVPSATVSTLTDTINFTGGDVGIGVTPTERLHVNGNVQVDGKIYVPSSDDFISVGTTPTSFVPANAGFYGNCGTSANSFQHVFGIKDGSNQGFVISKEGLEPTTSAKILQVKRDNANGNTFWLINNATGSALVQFEENGDNYIDINGTAGNNRFRVQNSSGSYLFNVEGTGNVGIGTNLFGTNAAQVISQELGTAPTTSPANVSQIYTADHNGAGTATTHILNEEGDTIILFQGAALTASTGNTIDAVYGTEERDEIQNLVTRVNELETRLQAHGLIA